MADDIPPTTNRSYFPLRVAPSAPTTLLSGGQQTSPPEAIELTEASPQRTESKRPLPSPNPAATLTISPRLERSPSGQGRSTTAASTWPSEGGLSHIDVPRKFGEAAEYWKFYDELSDRYDKDMNKILGANLDVLLIFAGLFSAVNTAFIVLSLASLSPPPDDRVAQLLTLLAEDRGPPTFQIHSTSTQDIRVNSCLSASLACSLLAAFGAVMAKQWVLHYARATVGTLESQGRTRQRKLNGVNKYRFQNAVESLPILLQISLILFFIGLLDYLNSLNSTVAYVVLAFSLAGVVIYTVTVFIASIDPQCPFQTPVSIFMQQSYLRCKKVASRYFGSVARFLAAKRKGTDRNPSNGIAPHLVQAGEVALRPTTEIANRNWLSNVVDAFGEVPDAGFGKDKDYRHDHHNDEEDMIDNQTACWIVETSEHSHALLSAARNIPSLRKIDSSELGINGIAFDRLLSLFKEYLGAYRATGGHEYPGQSGPLESAVVYGRALCHCVVGSTGDGDYFAYRSQDLQWPQWRKNSGNETYEFILMKACIKGELPKRFCLAHPKNSLPRPSSALPIYISMLLGPLVETKEFRIKASWLDRVTLVQWLISTCLNHQESCFPATVSLSAWALGELPALVSDPASRPDEHFRKEWWDAYTTDCNLYPNFIKALEVYHHYDRLPDALQNLSATVSSEITSLLRPREYVEAYTSLVRCVGSIIETSYRHQDILNQNTLELDTAIRQTLLTVDHQLASQVAQEGDSLAVCLARLRTELNTAMESLRMDGLEAMLPQLTTPAPDAHDPAATSDEVGPLNRLRDAPKLISTALQLVHEGTRYAALAIMHDHGLEWFNPESDQISTNFKDAQLMSSLKICLDDLENFELVSGIFARLAGHPIWRAEMQAQRTLEAYDKKALEVLNKKPTFRRLEVFLDLWIACREHSECRPFVERCSESPVMLAVIGGIRQVVERDTKLQPVPYVPASLREYALNMIETQGSSESPVEELKSAYEELRRSSTSSWWSSAGGW